MSLIISLKDRPYSNTSRLFFTNSIVDTNPSNLVRILNIYSLFTKLCIEHKDTLLSSKVIKLAATVHPFATFRLDIDIATLIKTPCVDPAISSHPFNKRILWSTEYISDYHIVHRKTPYDPFICSYLDTDKDVYSVFELLLTKVRNQV